MSGRKSTEVNSMLARGKNARESGVGNYLNSLLSSKKKLSENQKSINKISDWIDSVKINISSESKTEFQAESKELQEKYDSIKKKNIKVNYDSDIAEADLEQRKIDDELNDADKKQANIRDKIKKKKWYCDEEYKEASKLVQVYKKISENDARNLTVLSV